MKFFNLIKKSLPVLIGILILWCGLFFYSYILNKSNKETINLVPKDVNFVFQLKIKDFIKSSAYSLIFKSKDQGLLNSFESFLNKQRKGTGKSNDFGIDFTQDITIYGQSYKNGEVYVVLFNLFEKEKFSKNFPHYLTRNQSIKVFDNIGVLATYFGKETLTKKEINNFTQNLKFSEFPQAKILNSNDFFDIRFNNYELNENFILDKGSLTGTIDENRFTFNGQVTTFVNNNIPSEWSLIPDGFHLQNSIISNTIQDSIQQILFRIGISIPKIEQFSINYHGIEIQETEKGIIFTPIFDLLLNLKDEFNSSQLISNPEVLNEFGFVREKNIIHAGKIEYYIDSLDNKTLFIGTKINSIVHRKNKTIFEIGGDLSKLTSIKGSGFIVSFIGLLPQFKASKNLFEKVEKIDIKTISQKGKITISGDLTFKNNAYLYNEILKFYLTFKGEY